MRQHMAMVWITLWLVQGCSVLPFVGDDEVQADIDWIQVIAEPGANRNTATALDIVFIYGQDVADMLPDNGPDWFKQKAKLLKLFPDGIDLVELQVPPAQIIERVTMPSREDDAIQVIAFANYLDVQGQYPINLTTMRRVIIRLTPGAVSFAEN